MQAIHTTAGRQQTATEIGKNNFLAVTWLQSSESLALQRSACNCFVAIASYKAAERLHKPRTRAPCVFTPVSTKAHGLRIGDHMVDVLSVATSITRGSQIITSDQTNTAARTMQPAPCENCLHQYLLCDISKPL